ncbi:MAG: TetR/AcrR family transcriptional regulator [Lachnospiraceae bacterium]|nr:TetR/AcrR family transcriptional regulator [Lachnospiraceae bacterium]
MAQVLKEEIHDRIIASGIDVFYEKNYRTATMKEIAAKARIPVSLIYNYFKNKEELFEKIAGSLPIDPERIAREEERVDEGLPSDKYRNVTEDYILSLIENYKVFIIVMDKSAGSGYEHAKDNFIGSLEAHIKKQLAENTGDVYDDMFAHIMANNFIEGILEVARHYRDKESSRVLLDLVIKCYYEGVNSLF